ncbi:hypothetical protein Ptr902_05903 [Pyrenophora tritici-repentis]|nr:hypothetical protein Ptr902_05903 [Pyrenophora tritici-repentis]
MPLSHASAYNTVGSSHIRLPLPVPGPRAQFTPKKSVLLAYSPKNKNKNKYADDTAFPSCL